MTGESLPGSGSTNKLPALRGDTQAEWAAWPPVRPRLEELLSSCRTFSTILAGIQDSILVLWASRQLAGVTLTSFLNLGDGRSTAPCMRVVQLPMRSCRVTCPLLACPESPLLCLPPTSASTPVPKSSPPSVQSDFSLF